MDSRIDRWQKLLNLGLLPIALGIAGCTTLGPDYKEPDVAWLKDWQPDLYGQLGAPESHTPELGTWWQRFNDPVLNELIAQARANNLGMRIAGLRILESRAAVGIATSVRYPQVQQIEATGGARNSRRIDGDGNSRTVEFYDVALNAGWELDFWGRFERAIESADAAFFSSVQNQRDFQVLLAAQVADLYYAYLTASSRIQIANYNVDLQSRSLEITQRLFDEGQSSELNLQQAKTQYLATLSTIPALELSLIQIRNALAVVLGRPPGPILELENAPEALPEIDPIQVTSAPAELLMRRPDVRSAAWLVAAQSAQIGIAEAEYYPAISLFGSLGLSGNSLLNSNDSVSLTAGPSVRWNIFDWGRIENNVRLQDIRLQQAIENFQNQVLLATREIDDAAIAVVKTQEQNEPLTDSVRAAERSLKLANDRFSEGYADFQRVLDAQRVLAAQLERELLNRGNNIRAIIGLYRAFGGGWTSVPISDLIPEETRETMKSRTKYGSFLEEPIATQ